MKRRIAVWAGLGIVAACIWLLYVAITPQKSVALTLREPVVRAAMLVTCPVIYMVRFVPLPFWLAVAMNGTTYALFGMIIELLRRQWSISKAV